MNFSEIKLSVYTYLGYKGVDFDENIDKMIENCLCELEKIVQFRYVYKAFESAPAFLLKEPYIDFLSGSSSVILVATTLGAEVDRRIKYLGKVDVQKSLVTDACASALLEYLADGYEKKFGDERTYRFCPGYGGSEIYDIKYIFELIKPQSIGITLLDSNLMLPMKSMAGIIGVGKKLQKTCKNCINLSACAFRKEGKTCYNPQKT